MNTYWKTMSQLMAACLTLIMLVSVPSSCVGQEDVLVDYEDGWVLTTYYALRDTNTGLEWGKHIPINSHVLFPEMHVTDFYNTWTPRLDENGDPVLDGNNEPILDPPAGWDFSGPLVDGERISYRDWRPPTIGELLVAIDHGLLNHLYADFSYAPGDQAYGTPKGGDYPNDGIFGSDEYWSTCTEKVKGIIWRYKFQFTPEYTLEYWRESGAGWHIGVRGKPADHSNCPGSHYKPPKPSK